jgi:hypothetical protein
LFSLCSVASGHDLTSDGLETARRCSVVSGEANLEPCNRTPGVSAVWTTVIPIAISTLALVVSAVTLWRTYFAPFALVAAVGAMKFCIHQIKNDENSWRLPHFAVSIDFANAGSRIGRITELRAVVYYVDLPIEEARETFDCLGEFDPVKYEYEAKSRLGMMRSALLGGANPFVLLPKSTVTKFYVFSTRWDQPVRQKRFNVDVEVLTDNSKQWQNVGTWRYTVPAGMWLEIEAGTSLGVASQKPAIEDPRIHPPDLHKYTLDSDLEAKARDYELRSPSFEITPVKFRLSSGGSDSNSEHLDP